MPEVFQNRVAVLSRPSCGALMKTSNSTARPSGVRRFDSTVPTSTRRNSTGAPMPSEPPSLARSLMRVPGVPSGVNGGSSRAANRVSGVPGSAFHAPSI